MVALSEQPFQQSAASALAFYSSLSRISSLHAQREGMPSTLEMLTVCRETGCRLTELECYARAVDSAGVVLLCGGSPELAATTARRLGFEVDFFEISELPLMWKVQGGRCGRRSPRSAPCR